MNEKTIQNITSFLTRFGPYLCLVAAVAAVMVFLPGDDETDTVAAGNQFGEFQPDQASSGSESTSDFGAGSPSQSTQSTVGGADQGSATATSSPGASSSGQSVSSGQGSTSDRSGAGGTSSSSPSATQPSQATPAQQSGSGSAGGMGPNCDPNTGRIKIPSHRAPPCVPPFSGDNGGATYKGVTADTIRLAVYIAQDDPAAQAILAAAGAEDSNEEQMQQYRELAEFYGSYYETYGRQVELIFIQGSGEAEDDAVGRADAKRVIDADVFGVVSAPNNVFVDEVVAAGIMCYCTTSLPNSFYTDRAPFVWSGNLMSSTQGYVHRAEFVGKRLAGRKAVHAGDALMHTQERVFGLAYYDDQQQSYRPGVDFMVQHLRERYGVELAVEFAYQGFPNTEKSQEAARPLIQKMKSEGVTSVLCACDPFAPIFFTQEATRQQYFPEWVITGSAFTDTTLFGRTYDQQQWQNAFGVSFLSARVPEEKTDLYHKLFWHFGHEPPADGTYGLLNGWMEIFWTGVHHAGPNLNPGTFRDGLFNAAPTGVGKISVPQTSYSPAGKMWPFDDYTSFDDITLIWWDPTAQGEDEVGNQGVGMYRYVDMGKRYAPGQQPNSPTKAFDKANTVTVYEDYPPGDEPPDYPPPR